MSDFDKMQDEFNKEVIRRQNIIRALSGQEDSLKVSIDNLNKKHQELIDEISSKQSVVDGLDATIKLKNDDFETSKKARTDILDSRDMALRIHEENHDNNVKKYEDNVQELNNRINALEDKKTELLKKIQEWGFSLQGKLSDLSDVIKGV